MSNKLASFMYGGEQYFVVLDGGYLQSSFEGKNAVTTNELISDPGFGMAFAQTWGKTRYPMCPVSDDAVITKKGDMFVGFGTCGDIKFELHDNVYVVKPLDGEPVEEEQPATEEPPIVDEPPVEEHAVEETPEEEEQSPEEPAEEEVTPAEDKAPAEEAAEEEQLVTEEQQSVSPEEAADQILHAIVDSATMNTYHGEPTSGTPIEEPRERLFFGGYAEAKCQFAGKIKSVNRKTNSLIVDNSKPKRTSFRGVNIRGQKAEYEKDEESAVPEVVPEEPIIEEEKVESTVVEEKKPEIRVPVSPKEYTKVDSSKLFTNAPKMSSSNGFDPDAFLSSLSEEQCKVLQMIPEDLLGSMATFTSKPINTDRLKKDGIGYCMTNRWAMSGEWYAIDNISDLSRYFYCTSTNEYYNVPTKTLKGWMRCKELQKVG